MSILLIQPLFQDFFIMVKTLEFVVVFTANDNLHHIRSIFLHNLGTPVEDKHGALRMGKKPDRCQSGFEFFESFPILCYPVYKTS